MKIICEGTQIVYALSDQADLSQWPLIVDGQDQFINGREFEKTVLENVSVPDVPQEFWMAVGGAVVVDQMAMAAAAEDESASHVNVALALLAASDLTVLRCLERGTFPPAEWLVYRQKLRMAVAGISSEIPQRPEYPM